MANQIIDWNGVLCLNSLYQRLGFCTVRDAITAMTSHLGKTPPKLAISIETDENGKLVHSMPLEWDEWVKLPVRKGDLAIPTHRGAIRCPTVLLSQEYSRLPLKEPKLTKDAILVRDGFMDQYTGEKLPRSELNIDHVIPQDLGGKDTWYNMVACKKDRNFKKGNKRNRQVGLRLIRKPMKPKPQPISFFVKDNKHPDHAYFPAF